MGAIQFRTLESEEEIESYLKKFEGYVGVKLPYDYSVRSTIIGVFQDEEMVAGYMLVTRPEFRSLLFVPDAVKERNAFFRNDQYEMMEVNGVWISAAVKSAATQYRIWIRMMWDVFAARKKFILLMADLKNANIKKIHDMTNPTVIYEGAPMLMAGSKSHSSIRVAYTTRWQMILNMPRYWMAYRSRQRKSDNRSRDRAYARTAKVG